MREEKDRRDRVTRRSSTGIGKRFGEARRREPIRDFDSADELYRDETYRSRQARRNDTRRAYEEERAQYDERDGRYDDRRSDRRDSRRDERYEDYRYGDRYTDREYDDLNRASSRRQAPQWDAYRFDEDEPRNDRRDDRRDEPRRQGRYDRREGGQREGGRRPARKRVGGDTELFVHQIVPYVMFWIGLFAAVSFVLRDLVGGGESAGVFGSWFADFLGGLFGPGAYALPLFFVVLSLRWKRFVKEGALAKKLLLSTAFVFLLSGIIHVFMDGARGSLDATGLYATGAMLSSGGIFGGFVGEWLGYALRLWGTILLAIPLLIIVGIYLVGMTLSGIWQRISCKYQMMSERRAERRKALYDGEEKQPRAEGKQNNAERIGAQTADEGEAKPAPFERMRYTFKEEEDELPRPAEKEPRIEAEPPVAECEVKEKEPHQPASSVGAEDTVRIRSSADIVDIPDDLPEMDEPADDLQAILNRAGHDDSSEQKLDQILREISQRSEQEARAKEQSAPAATVEEKPLQGTYYAPFALPHRPEPKREQPLEAEQTGGQTAFTATPVEQPEKKASYLTEEPLGSLNPIHREPKPAPAEPVPAQTEPAEEVLAYRPVQPTPVQSMPAQKAPIPEIHAESAFAQQERHDEAPLVSAVTFDVDEPVATAAEPAVSEPIHREKTPAQPMGGFSFADDLSAEETQPARGTRIAFELDETPPAREAVTAEQETAPAVAFTREEIPAQAECPVEAVRSAVDPLVRPLRPKPQVLTRNEPVKDEKPAAPPVIREYRLPHIELLKEDKSIKENDHTEEMREKIEILRETLKSFNIRVKEQVDCSRGPTITRYELRPEPGVSVRSVMNRMDDISLNMAAPVRIEAPIPGKPAIGIEVPNAQREMVFMRTVLESEQYKSSTKPLEVPLGLDVGGAIQMCDLAKMPHLLVAGSTGSGKSVCINTILISLMFKTSPADLRLILIDPKQVEFTSYAHIPHLYAPIVTDPARAVGVLACAVQEMERRYSLIKDVGVRNIEGYNEAVKNDPEREHLPYMVIVIDEFADLKMACTNNDVETFTCRLAQKARAAGMHLIIGTQRPTVNVITGNLKNNIPSRIAFKVTQQTDSRTILDANGAEALIGRGDMLYMTAGLPKPNRVQGAFVSDDEVEAVADYIRDHNDEVQYNQAFMDQIEAEMARAANAGRKDDDGDDFDDDGDDEDPKFREAVELAIETQKVATSLLQRRLGVGYGRAAKIIDRMEALGYVSAPEGNKARKVLITHQEYAARMMEGEFEEDPG